MNSSALRSEILARRAVSSGDPGRAWKFLKERLASSPANGELHLLAAWLLEELGKFPEALRHCRAALALEAKPPLRPAAPALNGLRVLVAGATGFIGRRLVARLLARGAVVHALGRPGSPGWSLFRPHCRLHRHAADLARPSALARAIAAAASPVAVYLAKNRGPGGAGADRRLTLNFAAALRRSGKTAYLVRAALPVAAEADQALAEKMAAASGSFVATLKLSRVYGPGQPRQSLQGKSGGPQDYLFVDEAAEAFVRALLRPQAAGRRLEIRSGVFLTAAQAARIETAVRKKRLIPRLRTFPRDPQTPAALAEAVLGWRPRIPLAAGLRRIKE